MKILIPIKCIVDPESCVTIQQDRSSVDVANGRIIINPFDEIAIEAGLQLKEQGNAHEVILTTTGSDVNEVILRKGLAMGADRAWRIATHDTIEPLGIAKIVKMIVDSENQQSSSGVGLVILGKWTADYEEPQTGPMLAALLGWPQATCVSALTIEDSSLAIVTCEVDNGQQVLAMNLPAVITVDLSLNEPRYVTLPGIMQGKKKPINSQKIDNFSVDVASRISVLEVQDSYQRPPCSVIEISEIAQKLCESLGFFVP